MSRPPLTSSVLRYAGLVGTVLLALAAVTIRHRWSAFPLWFTGILLVGGAWLVLGRRLAGVRLRWLLVTGALWAVPLLLTRPLASNDAYAYACQGSLVAAGIDPYTHGVDALPCPWIGQMGLMWRGTPSPYGPLWLTIAGAAASTGSLAAAVVVFRIVALAGLALLGLAGHRVAVRLGVDPSRAAWLALLNPLVLVHVVSGAHNDALMAGLLMAALAVALAGRGRPVPALAVGALVGLAVAVKATALPLLPFAILLLAPDRRWWTIIRTGLVTCLGLLGCYGVLWAATGYGLGWLPALQTSAPLIVEATSIPTGVGLVIAHSLKVLGYPGPAEHAVAVARAVALAVLVAVLVGLWLRARRRFAPHDVVLATGLALVAGVLLAPLVFPWYLLTALAVLAYGLVNDRIRYWVGVALIPVVLVILPNGNGLGAIFRRPGGVFDTILVLGGLVLGGWYLRRRRRVRTREPDGEPAARP